MRRKLHSETQALERRGRTTKSTDVRAQLIRAHMSSRGCWLTLLVVDVRSQEPKVNGAAFNCSVTGLLDELRVWVIHMNELYDGTGASGRVSWLIMVCAMHSPRHPRELGCEVRNLQEISLYSTSPSPIEPHRPIILTGTPRSFLTCILVSLDKTRWQ